MALGSEEKEFTKYVRDYLKYISDRLNDGEQREISSLLRRNNELLAAILKKMK
ncbi:hypothetical protein HYU22_01240 [Candidatus Woesearchaeota archaeon]|nr:hypothetical protein [Candidatus Woesearchaeota archaeon]